jgi:rhamnose utilization protein RhaD (predicted bifunctional aldolase and dehydrogenase)
MKSNWSDADFNAIVDAYEKAGINRDVAIRTYTTRLLGSEPKLVLHGGGNTSVKTVLNDHDGTPVEVLCVKGSGWDMGMIEPAGLPALNLERLKAMVNYDTLSDDDMVMLQRRLLLDPSSPNPSVQACRSHPCQCNCRADQSTKRGSDHSRTLSRDDYRALCHARV